MCGWVILFARVEDTLAADETLVQVKLDRDRLFIEIEMEEIHCI
jgi:hypothetical protein